MNERIKLTVGWDVHKESIAIAYAEAGSRDAPQFLGSTP